MAGVKRAGAGCYCGEHSFLQAMINSMLLGENDALILDMCAGAEHLVRGAVKGADLLLIVSEATRACIDITRTLRALGGDLGIKRIHIVANKVRNEKEELLIRASFRRGELIGLIRMSEAVAEHAVGVGLGAGREPRQCMIPADFKELFNKLLSINTQ
jgi:CO dehydrogenase maturation factor